MYKNVILFFILKLTSSPKPSISNILENKINDNFYFITLLW